MGQAEERDVVDDCVGNKALAMSAICAAVLLCPTSTPDEHQLASSILARGADERGLGGEGESEPVAATFNRLLDVPIDAANRSGRERSRLARRRMMAEDLDEAGLILIEKNFLAGLVADRIQLEMTQASIGVLTEAPHVSYRDRDGRAFSDMVVIGGEGGVAFAAEMAAAGGVQHLDYLDGGTEQPNPVVND